MDAKRCANALDGANINIASVAAEAPGDHSDRVICNVLKELGLVTLSLPQCLSDLKNLSFNLLGSETVTSSSA